MASYAARDLLLALILLLAAALSPAGAESIWIEGEAAAATTFNRHSWYWGSADLRRDLMSPGEVEVTDGAWLAHYAPGDPTSTATARWDLTVTEGGTYAWWIRLNPIWAVHRYAVDGAPLAPLDLSDFRERVNIVRTIDIRWLAWVKVGDFALAPGPHTLTVEVQYSPLRGDSHGGVDCMALVNFPWEPLGILRPGEVVAPPGPDVWFPLRAGDDPFSPASITDLSRLLHRPAGMHGPLRPSGAGFELRDRPGVPVKLWGLDVGSLLPTEALQLRQARFYAKHGVNLVRFHPLEDFLGPLVRDPVGGGRILDPAPLDAFDRWFFVLKENGIYLAVSPFYPHVVTPDDGYPPALYAELGDLGAGKSSSGMVPFMPVLQDAEWVWLRAFLEHVNPYTGLAYAADPALAMVETHNEDSLFWHWPLNDLAGGAAYPLHTAELKRQWMDWVAARHGDDAALAAAWGAGMRAGDSVSNPDMDVYGAWQMAADGPDWGAGPVAAERARLGDFIRFLAETQRGCYQRRRDAVRALGFEGVFVTTAWWAGGPAAQAANLWTDSAGDAIDRHAYWGGGAGGWRVDLGAVNNGTHLDRPGRGIVGGHVYASGGVDVPLYQVEDRPTIMTEWCSSVPNQWKAEAAPLFAFYGMGLQGWDASMHFAGSLPRMGSGWPQNAWSPNSFVTETPHYLGQFPALAFAVLNGHVREADLAAARRIAVDDLFRGIDPLSRDLPGGGYPAETNLRTPPEVTAIGRVTFQAEDGLPASAKTDWDASWDRTGEVIRSTTSELVWDYGSRVVTVATEKTQAIVGWAGGTSFDLPGVGVEVTTPFVSLIFTPLDDRPLVDSEQILITALARDAQLNTEYSADGLTLVRMGGPPLLLEPVQATITFKGAPIVSAAAVDIHGVPMATTLPIAGNAITIDGTYETYYYEVRRAGCAPFLARTQATTLAPLSPVRAALFLGAPDADGITLDAAAPLAEVPYLCPFASAEVDPERVLDPGSNALVMYQVSGGARSTVRVVKEGGLGTVRVYY